MEFDAVVRHLSGERRTIYLDQMAYVQGAFQGKHHNYVVIVCEPGMKNTDMALATDRAIKSFQPQIALLVGIAGGVKDVKVGDVAVASSAFNYDAGKESEKGFLPRPTEYSFSKELLARAKGLSRSDRWKKRTTDRAPTASIWFGPVASGDKVIAAVNNPTFRRIEQFLSHVLFLEMEAGGFGLAVQPYRSLHALVVRGISDMCLGKSEESDSIEQPIAAARAAAVVFELLYDMDCTPFINSAAGTREAAILQNVNNSIIGSNVFVGGNLTQGDKIVYSNLDNNLDQK